MQFADETNKPWIRLENAVIEDTDWHHVSLVFDRDTAVYAYIDGELVDQSSEITQHQGSVSNNNNKYIGKSSKDYLNGQLDDFRIYNSALSKETIAELVGIVPPPAPVNYTISGYINNSKNGAWLSNVTVTLSGDKSATDITTSSGYYAFADCAEGGNYTVTPQDSDYTFTPLNNAITNLSQNTTCDFTGVAITASGPDPVAPAWPFQ